MWLRRVSLSSVLLLVLGSAIAIAKPTPLLDQTLLQNLGGKRGEVQGELKVLEQLNLTSEQTQKVKAIYYQYKEEISQQKKTLRQTTRRLRALLVSTASTEEIRTQYRQVETVRQQLETASFESMLAMREVLTPAQRSQFAQLMEQQEKTFYSRMANQRGQ
ncbi:MAG TPA: Spy/CpxP family protein refolding chaperone [Waterburya sp.]|jgi:Spy/CpxP family protein refolding chaperone